VGQLIVLYATGIVFAKLQAETPDSCGVPASIEKRAGKLSVGHMNRPGVADLFCACLWRGQVPAHLEGFIDAQAKWILGSGIVPDGAAAPSDSMQEFFGIAGLRTVSHLCREHLKTLSGDMSGWVIRENCSFAFGRVRLQWHPAKECTETRFVAKLLWSDLQILLGEIRIMWPFVPNEPGETAPEPSGIAAEVTAASDETVTGVSRFAM
jgi:hypothetical protein